MEKFKTVVTYLVVQFFFFFMFWSMRFLSGLLLSPFNMTLYFWFLSTSSVTNIMLQDNLVICLSKPWNHLLLQEDLFFLAFSRATLVAYGGSLARRLIGAVATSLRQSHGNAASEPRLQPTPQLMATPDPKPTEQGKGSNPQPHGS